MENRDSSQKGIGGWLVLPLIGLFVSPIRIIYFLSKEMFPLFKEGTWSLLTVPGQKLYHELWAPMLYFEVIGNLFFAIFAIVLVVVMLKKMKKFPMFMIIFLAANCVFVILDAYFATLIPMIANMSDLESDKEILRAIIGAAVWIPYFLLSKRVKATFIK